MSLKTIRLEPLTEDEIDFLSQKQEKESRAYYFGLKIMAVVCLLIPLITANILILDKKPQLTFWESYFYTQIIMILVFIFVRLLFFNHVYCMIHYHILCMLTLNHLLNVPLHLYIYITSMTFPQVRCNFSSICEWHIGV